MEMDTDLDVDADMDTDMDMGTDKNIEHMSHHLDWHEREVSRVHGKNTQQQIIPWSTEKKK